jgi:choline-sulfatase
VSLAAALSGDVVPERDVPLEYLAEGVRAPQVTLVRGDLKLVRELGEPDLVYDVALDPGERENLAGDPDLRDEIESLAAAADARWDLDALDRAVRTSQERRRLVARSLATGEVTRWDLSTADGPYIRTGDDFWATLERARRV